MIFYVGQNLKFIICNSLILLFYVIYIILGLGYLFPYYYVLLMLFIVKLEFCVFPNCPRFYFVEVHSAPHESLN